MMARSTIGALALLLGAACGGGGAPAPSVRSNTEEVQGKREEIKSAGEAPVDSSGEVLALLKSMDEPDPEVRWRAEFALGRVGPRGLKGIADALKHLATEKQTGEVQPQQAPSVADDIAVDSSEEAAEEAAKQLSINLRWWRRDSKAGLHVDRKQRQDEHGANPRFGSAALTAKIIRALH
jgi:hypothetical protein